MVPMDQRRSLWHIGMLTYIAYIKYIITFRSNCFHILCIYCIYYIYYYSSVLHIWLHILHLYYFHNIITYYHSHYYIYYHDITRFTYIGITIYNHIWVTYISIYWHIYYIYYYIGPAKYYIYYILPFGSYILHILHILLQIWSYIITYITYLIQYYQYSGYYHILHILLHILITHRIYAWIYAIYMPRYPRVCIVSYWSACWRTDVHRWFRIVSRTMVYMAICRYIYIWSPPPPGTTFSIQYQVARGEWLGIGVSNDPFLRCGIRMEVGASACVCVLCDLATGNAQQRCPASDHDFHQFWIRIE